MKIEKVHIKNIKGIKDLELLFRKDNEILDVIVLAGVNGSGKTTILESIKDFFDNKSIDFNDIEKSNVNLDIFFEEFEKEKIVPFINIDSPNNIYKVFHMLGSYNSYVKENKGLYIN